MKSFIFSMNAAWKNVLLLLPKASVFNYFVLNQMPANTEDFMI